MKETIRILHFNDVYDLQEADHEPIGGVARFKTAIEQFRTPNTLVLFSGDAFSPSLLSNIHQGQQMIQPLNALGIDVACLGNHDFDFPLEHVIELKKQTNFPWLLSNVYDKKTGNRLADAEQFVILERGGLRIGIFGLAEKEWLEVMATSYHGRCDYVDFVEMGSRMVYTLRGEHKCDFIIALTHMMGHNDSKLAEKVDGIDMILGGHDHMIRHQQHGGTHIIKSGTNFKMFSVAYVQEQPQAEGAKGKSFKISSHLEEVTKKYAPDPVLEPYVKELYDEFHQRQSRIVCYADCEIDLKFGFIRCNESPYVGMYADWYRFFTNADCVILCCGTFRNDCFLHQGPLSYGTVINQIEDKIVVKKVNGAVLLQALENAIAIYPNYSGRFASYSGIQFTWDSKREPFHRVLAETVLVGGKPLDLAQEYTLCVHEYHSNGGDGFAMLKGLPFVIEAKDSMTTPTLTLEMLDPENPRCIAYQATANPHNHRIIEYEGKKLVAFSPQNSRRATML